MKARWIPTALAAALLFGACSDSPKGVTPARVSAAADHPAIHSYSLRAPAERAARPKPIHLRDLPPQGFLLSGLHGKATTFVSVTGETILRLQGFSLYGNPGSSSIWLSKGRIYYRLFPRRSLLKPFDRRRARSLMYDEPGSDLPAPLWPQRHRPLDGMWRFVFDTPVSGARLGQWSGECEVPTAYWIDVDGTETIITGQSDPSLAPDSIALGWTQDGLAAVLLPVLPCGGGTQRSGIYLYSYPGHGELLYRTGPFPWARMWGRSG